VVAAAAAARAGGRRRSDIGRRTFRKWAGAAPGLWPPAAATPASEIGRGGYRG